MTLTIEAPVKQPVAPTTKTTADVLEHAALIIEERGWTQQTYVDPLGRVCVLGAIALAQGTSEDDVPEKMAKAATAAEKALEVVLPLRFAESGMRPASWFNDDPATKAGDVVAALRRAAELVR